MVTRLANPVVVASQGHVALGNGERTIRQADHHHMVPLKVVDAEYKVVKGRGFASMLVVLAVLGGLAVLSGFIPVPASPHRVVGSSGAVDLYAETLALNSAISGHRVVVTLTEATLDRSFRTGQMCETADWMLTPRRSDTYVVQHEYVASGPNCPAGAVVRKMR